MREDPESRNNVGGEITQLFQAARSHVPDDEGRLFGFESRVMARIRTESKDGMRIAWRTAWACSLVAILTTGWVAVTNGGPFSPDGVLLGYAMDELWLELFLGT